MLNTTPVTWKRGNEILQQHILVDIQDMDVPEASDLQAQYPTDAFWVFTNYEYDIKKGDVLINEANTSESYRVFARVRKYRGHAEIPAELIPVDEQPPESGKSINKYEYDIAISFAGEDRSYAEALARALLNRGVSIFYDKYEKATLWGKNLYDYLSDLYQHKARYCVMMLSQHYSAKVWTNLERQAAQARAFQERQEYILPVRLDDTEIPGLLSTIGYLNWHKETVETIADIIMEKLS